MRSRVASRWSRHAWQPVTRCGAIRDDTAMEIVIESDAQALAVRAAGWIADAIRRRPDLSLLVATGASPMATYAELAGLHARGALDTSALRPVQLDEYLGLAPGDPRSLAGWMERSFSAPLGIEAERVIQLDLADDPELGCAMFARAVRAAGGIDLAVLGLGPNGHLGFNEPPSPADAPTRVVELTPESIVSNETYWGAGNVPVRAATAGMDLIMAARRVLLIVEGERKREILARTLDDPPTPLVPASLLQRHPDVTVLCDRAAREWA